MPQLKLGRVFKAPKANALRLRKFWCADAAPPPVTFDVDASILALTGLAIPFEMDDNDEYGCCVMAAQAKFLRRFYALEAGVLISVSAPQVLTAYMAQTGGADNGLIPDDSFAYWASNGWTAGNPSFDQKIITSARVDATNQNDVELCISKLGGCFFGGEIPEVWMNATGPWQPEPGRPIAGGHEMYAYAYDATGVTVETWGRPQVITWEAVAWCFAESNDGEAAGLIRGNDAPKPVDGLDTAALMADLQAIQEA